MTELHTATVAHRHRHPLGDEVADETGAGEQRQAAVALPSSEMLAQAPPRPHVLVLMATRNGAPWITAQLRSVLSQQGVRCTLVLRDDASTDATLAVVRAVCAGHPEVSVVRASVPSGSAAANFFALMRTVDAAGYDYVAFADQDDVWRQGKLSRAVTCLGHSGAAGYSSAVRAFWPDGRTAVLRQHPEPTTADHLFEGAGQGCTFVMRGTFFRSVQPLLTQHRGLFDAIHYHDWAMYALCRVKKAQWILDDWVSLDYRQHGGNDTGARRGVAAIRKRLALVRSGWYQAQIDAVVRMCIAAADGGPGVAPAYRRLADVARTGCRSRLALCAFVLRSGRRRKTDRLVLAWAALLGHLSRADIPSKAAR